MLKIIPRSEHGISRRNISQNALRVLYRLREGGFLAYLVGGAVRDLLLGGSPKDYDVATDARPEQVRALFRNCRLIGRRFRLAHVMFGSEIIEVATFRGSDDDGTGARHTVDGRIVRDNVYGGIEDDAVRRDFTVNALYYAIDDFSVHDYVGGFEAIQRRELRLIGEPKQRYIEDPVRMLRAVRLAAKLKFSIEPQARAEIANLAHLLDESAPARLFDEFLKMFMSGNAESSMDLLRDTGLLKQYLPAVEMALANDSDGKNERMLRSALRSTDTRVREERSVTAAYLLAAMLWPATEAEALSAGYYASDPQSAWSNAINKVVGLQTEKIALPKRFTLPMQEIWDLQPRFLQMNRKKVFRLLAHPRFRAAYDFLLLRAEREESLRDSATWWTTAQSVSPEEVGEMLLSESLPRGNSPVHRPKSRRRASQKKKLPTPSDSG